MPRHAPDKTIGEDTNHKFTYSVSVGSYICFGQVVACDAYDAERRAKKLYSDTIGLEPDHEPRATFTGRATR